MLELQQKHLTKRSYALFGKKGTRKNQQTSTSITNLFLFLHEDMATSLPIITACEYDPEESNELFVGFLPYAEDLSYTDYQKKQGLFAKNYSWPWIRPWPSENKYSARLHGVLQEAINQLPGEFSRIWIYRLINPLAYGQPQDASGSTHFRP